MAFSLSGSSELISRFFCVLALRLSAEMSITL
jgi:hypothetical protein